MQFCDDCGSMMRNEGGEMVCTNDDCGASAEQDAELAEQFVSTEEQTHDDVIETEEGANFAHRQGRPLRQVRPRRGVVHHQADRLRRRTADALFQVQGVRGAVARVQLTDARTG